MTQVLIIVTLFIVYFSGVFPDVGNRSPQFTEDGFENTFGTNHLGHFYLTLLMLEKLKKATPSRIVIVTSSLHDPEKRKRGAPPHLNFEDLQLTEPGAFNSFLAYSNSKLANLLFMYELNRRLPENVGVRVNALSPGWIPTTNLNRRPCVKCCLVCCFRGVCRCCSKASSLSKASDCVMYVATAVDDDVTGKYFEDNKESLSSVESRDEKVALKLWKASVKLLELENSMLMFGLN